MSGWIKLHRSLQDSSIASHPEYLAVWVHLMIRAQYSASEFVVGRQIVKLSVGQLVFGRIKFSSEIGVSENKVRAALDVLKSLNMITIKSMSKFSIISITNWQKYQDDNQQTTTKQPADSQQVTSTSPASSHIQEGKERKEGEESKELKDVSQDKPAKKPKAVKPDLDYSVWPHKPDQQIFLDWVAMRKKKRADLSQTVLNAFGDEFRMAATFGYSVDDCLRTAIASSWTGFKFSWMQNQNSRGSQNGNASQPKPSLIDRFITNNYGPGAGFENGHGSLGGHDSVIRGEVVEPVRRDPGRIGPMETDLIGDFKATGGGGFE